MNWPRKVPAFLDIDPENEVVVVTNAKKCPFLEQTAEQSNSDFFIFILKLS